MTEHQEHSVQVVIASGPEALGRAVLGFAFAVSAAVSGIEVTVILTLDGTAWLARDPTSADQTVNGFDSISAYMAVLQDQGVVIRLCSACAARRCPPARTQGDRPCESSFIGLTEVAIRACRGSTQTVVF